jgi:hypothetical protein
MTLRIDGVAPDSSVLHLFTAHPASVGETYAGHMLSAFNFGSMLLRASLACFVHGLLPFLFTSTASRSVADLYERMVRMRRITPVTVITTMPSTMSMNRKAWEWHQ